MASPLLTPVAPTRGAAHPLAASPTWIGSASNCHLQVLLPGVADHHVALLEREDGWWASEGKGRASVNGQPLSGTRLLADGDVIDIAPGCRYEFSSGAPRVARRAEEPAEVAVKMAKPRRVRRPGGRSWGLLGAVLALLVLLGIGGYALYVALFKAEKAPDILTDQQAELFDQLLVEAYDHIERGSTLLELGIPDAALQEFARGVNSVATSSLRDHPFVKPRIAALEASVAEIYRDRKLAVPAAYADARSSALSSLAARRGSLTVGQFAAAFGDVERSFRTRFARALEVTGRDHSEHLSLYGRGGALDLRTKNLTPTEVQFLVAECRGRGIRVKDFSADSVLQRQIRAAIAAGLTDRAGTGLHLHVDRFADRKDRWTVGR